ncbi:hypothetical protein ACDQ55_09475 [Chitinophaga sp. 30R24]|uniref:hypothetical protein n=1 Tax=Chitinophaga sp. 30R24 TaxID=3248838 RepID=UPI003B90DA19
MKKLMMSLALIIAAFSIQAQTVTTTTPVTRKDMRRERREEKITLKALEGRDVNVQSKRQFGIDFGNVPATWTHQEYFDVASFVNDRGLRTDAYYDYNGQLVGTTTMARFSDLPEPAQKDIIKHYTNYLDAPVVFYDDNEANDTDMILYGTQFDDADNYFIELKDKKGNPVVLRVNMEGNVSFFADMRYAHYE